MYTLYDYFNQIEQDSVELLEHLSSQNPKFIRAILSSLLGNNSIELFKLKQDEDLNTLPALQKLKTQLTYSRILKSTDNLMEVQHYSQYSEVLLKHLFCTSRLQSLLTTNPSQTQSLTQQYAQDIVLAFNTLNPHKVQMKSLYDQINSLSLSRQYEKVLSNFFTFISFPNSTVKQYYNKSSNIAKSMLLQELLINYFIYTTSSQQNFIANDLGLIKSFYINDSSTSKDACFGFAVYDKGNIINPDTSATTYDNHNNKSQVLSYLTDTFDLPTGIIFSTKSTYYEPIYLQISDEDMVCVNYPFLTVESGT